jgi:hypothetical protein
MKKRTEIEATPTRCAHCRARLPRGCALLCRICIIALPTWVILSLAKDRS